MTKFFHSILFLTLSLSIVLLPYSSVHARWAEEDEADVERISEKKSLYGEQRWLMEM